MTTVHRESPDHPAVDDGSAAVQGLCDATGAGRLQSGHRLLGRRRRGPTRRFGTSLTTGRHDRAMPHPARPCLRRSAGGSGPLKIAQEQTRGRRHQTRRTSPGHPGEDLPAPSHNIEWHDVESLFREVGTVSEGHDSKWTLTLGTESLILDDPKTKDMDIQAVVDLRRMLRTAGYEPQTG